MKKKLYLTILIIVLLISCRIYSNFNSKTIISNYNEYFAIPKNCTSDNNCESLPINSNEWFENWRNNEATKTTDNKSRNFANVLFVVDVSGSMINNKELSYINQVVTKFVQSLKEEDMMGISTYTPIAQMNSNTPIV